MVVLWVFLMIWLTFVMNPLKTKWLPQPFKKKIDIVVLGGIFFSLFLDIDGQSLRLRGPAISWWLFFWRGSPTVLRMTHFCMWNCKKSWHTHSSIDWCHSLVAAWPQCVTLVSAQNHTFFYRTGIFSALFVRIFLIVAYQRSFGVLKSGVKYQYC